MKIVILKRRSLFSDVNAYALFDGEREIGKLDDIGDGAKVEFGIEGTSWHIERSRMGIAEGRLSGIRNLLNRNSTGDYRLTDASGAEVATAHQPMLFEFTVAAGAMTLDVPRQKRQTGGKLDVMSGKGDVAGTLSRGSWKISGKREYFSSFTIPVDPCVEAFLLWLFAMCERRMENTSQPT